MAQGINWNSLFVNPPESREKERRRKIEMERIEKILKGIAKERKEREERKEKERKKENEDPRNRETEKEEKTRKMSESSLFVNSPENPKKDRNQKIEMAPRSQLV